MDASRSDVNMSDLNFSHQTRKSRTTDATAVKNSPKRATMTSATSVIKRIQSDPAINNSDFVVGVLNRQAGLEEIPFEAFVLEDAVSLDGFRLAAPQHRIQHFKYKDEKVWDKTENLDNVFGSTGSHLDIAGTIAIYLSKQGHQDSASKNEAERGSDCTAADADAASPRQNDDADSEQTSTKRKKLMNYFIALEITNKGLKKKFTKVQSELAYRFPQYWPYKMPEDSFHLTLGAMALCSPEDIQRCILGMNAAAPTITDLARRSLPISFEGVDHWATRTMFAKVRCPPELEEIVDVVKRALVDENVNVEGRKFKPHLSLFRAGNAEHWKKPYLRLSHYENVEFGEQIIDNIQVCKIGSLPETGFYPNIYKLDIVSIANDRNT